MSILVIGEKPSVSKELAKVLGADKKRKVLELLQQGQE